VADLQESNGVSPLILATARLQPAENGEGPRLVEWELARRLGGRVVQYSDPEVNPPWRRLEEAMRLDFSLARKGLSLLNHHGVVFSTSEKVGIPLLAFQHGNASIPHVMLAHNLLSPLKFKLLKSTGLLRKLRFLLCLSREELAILRRHSGLPRERVILIQGGCTDQRFFLPAPGGGEGFVLSTGATQRDYYTLLRGLGGLPTRVIVAAGSQWVKGPGMKGRIPSNFTLLPPQSLFQMRDLYARCAVVVIPLRRGTQHSAGRTTVAEAMASAKAVVATDLPGMRDYIEEGVNGLLVEEGDEGALRNAVTELLSSDKRLVSLGLAGRKVAEEKWNFDVYVEYLSRVLAEAARRPSPALASERRR